MGPIGNVGWRDHVIMNLFSHDTEWIQLRVADNTFDDLLLIVHSYSYDLLLLLGISVSKIKSLL